MPVIYLLDSGMRPGCNGYGSMGTWIYINRFGGVLVFEYHTKDVSAREMPSGSERLLFLFQVSDPVAGSAGPTPRSAKKLSMVKVDRPAT